MYPNYLRGKLNAHSLCSPLFFIFEFVSAFFFVLFLLLFLLLRAVYCFVRTPQSLEEVKGTIEITIET